MGTGKMKTEEQPGLNTVAVSPIGLRRANFGAEARCSLVPVASATQEGIRAVPLSPDAESSPKNLNGSD